MGSCPNSLVASAVYAILLSPPLSSPAAMVEGSRCADSSPPQGPHLPTSGLENFLATVWPGTPESAGHFTPPRQPQPKTSESREKPHAPLPHPILPSRMKPQGSPASLTRAETCSKITYPLLTFLGLSSQLPHLCFLQTCPNQPPATQQSGSALRGTRTQPGSHRLPSNTTALIWVFKGWSTLS